MMIGDLVQMTLQPLDKLITNLRIESNRTTLDDIIVIITHTRMHARADNYDQYLRIMPLLINNIMDVRDRICLFRYSVDQ